MIRTATADDRPVAEALYREFAAEISDAPWRDDDSEDELADLDAALGAGGVFLADEDGLAVARMTGTRVGELEFLYVKPEARRSGLAAQLIQHASTWLRNQGAEVLELDVLAGNHGARAAYERLGFAPVELRLAAPIATLLAERAVGPTFGSIHVQTDDAAAVERNVQKELPRLGRSGRTEITGPANGWVTVRDELCDRDPVALKRLGKELSYTSGGVVLAIGVEEGAIVHYTLYDRGSLVDEYVSVPEYHGSLPPGDVIALGSNPTVVARLTGAQPARVREIARTASSPSELPPADDLYTQIARLMGVEAVAHPL